MSSGECAVEDLWSAFARMRVAEGNLNDRLDLPHLLQLVPNGQGQRALDLGCGLGQSTFKLAELLGYFVCAVDSDHEMIVQARKLYSGSRIEWVESSFKDLNFGPNSFSLIVSCLSFHFVQDLAGLLKSCAQWLVDGGKLVFSVRHPIRTSNPLGQTDQQGKVGWIVVDYFSEMPREFSWLGQRCVNFHRPLSTYFHTLRECGFEVEALLEPSLPATTISEQTEESQSVPFFLTFACRKTR